MRWIRFALALSLLTSAALATGRLWSKQKEIIRHFPVKRTGKSAGPGSNLVFMTLAAGHQDDEVESTNDAILGKILAAIDLGIKKIQEPGYLAADFNVTVIARDTFCSSIYGAVGFFEIYTDWSPYINGVFGLACDYVLAPISRYSGVWDIPILTVGGRAQSFDFKESQYPTTTRLLGGHTAVARAIKGMMEGFNWTLADLVFRNFVDENRGYSDCALCLNAVLEVIEVPRSYEFERQLTRSEATKILTAISNEARLCDSYNTCPALCQPIISIRKELAAECCES